MSNRSKDRYFFYIELILLLHFATSPIKKCVKIKLKEDSLLPSVGPTFVIFVFFKYIRLKHVCTSLKFGRVYFLTEIVYNASQSIINYVISKYYIEQKWSNVIEIIRNNVDVRGNFIH